MPCKVLHVSEAFGGGIVSSLYSFAESTPEIDHHLLVCERQDQPLSKDLSARFSSISGMRRGFVGAVIDIRRKVEEVEPDFVHLHSSFAGVYGRMAGIDPARLVYSPHGFSFHRRSANPALRGIYFVAEKMLSSRSAAFAGVSLKEVELAQRMNPRTRSVFIPNTTDFDHGPIRHFENDGHAHVVSMGRLCPQKDPGFLLQILKRLPAGVRDKFTFTWVGGGDEQMTAALKAAGVHVTGWVNHAEAHAYLAECDLYLHVAAWEGFPMTVIEAAALGRPMIVRNISAFSGFDLPADALVDSPAEAAERLGAWVDSPDARSGTYDMIGNIRDICSKDRQRAALSDLYRADLR
ncbi:glycosyltransferase [Ancylobacter sp. G4_0304]|uniref:glycosyltransferase n=1 Tax=Ancylobacter sp. G4_0304 TaxID=3114289 RepID=UPI0039C74ACD